MDDLDRLYRRLVHNIRASRPEYLRIPFTVQELYEQLVPYRHNRRELAIETNQDYETAVARLLSGERGYVRTDAALQEALTKELASPTGDHGIFKEHAQTQLTLAPIPDTHTPMPTPASVPVAAASSVGGTGASTGAVVANEPAKAATDAAVAFDVMAPSAAAPIATPPTSTLLDSLSTINVPTGCRFCGGTLPEGRDVHYCPHCGENLKTKRCPACGAEMDTSWQFCISCGRRSG